MNWFRFKSCVKCGGDLALDQGDWLCLQCGTYYYSGLYQLPGLYQRPAHPETPNPQIPEPPAQKALASARSGPSINMDRSFALEPEVNRACVSVRHTDGVFDAWAKT